MSRLLGHAPTTVFRDIDDLTAAAPPEARGLPRDAVRLLVAADTDVGPVVSHTTFDRITEHLRPGDLVLVNNSATIAAEVDAWLEDRGPVVVHVATELDDCAWVIELRTSPDASRAVLDAHPGDEVTLSRTGRAARRDARAGHRPGRRPGAPSQAEMRLRLVAAYPEAGSSPTGEGNRLWRAMSSGSCDLALHLERHGRPIAYGYLDRRYPLTAYQTVFGTMPGSAEMASAGRPFTTDLVTKLVAGGVLVAPVTLHTGVSSQEAGEAPQPERFAVSAPTASLVNQVRDRGGRVVAVGTTVTRAIESAVDETGTVHASAGWTDVVISPDRPARVVDGLVTGWHNPDASHLLLVESVAGAALTQRAYDAAVAERYAWHEFGDAGLFLPAR
jgi:S-adenosylmethionine:tRNA ribosyltransferase-isomerase